MADQFITDLSKLDKATQDVLAFNGKNTTSGESSSAAEYLASRGGVNPVTGKYGDSYNPNTDLNDAEYLATIAGKSGVAAGKALNAATQKKLQAYIAANPNSPEAQAARVEARALAKGNAQKTVINVEQQTDGSSLVSYSDGSTETLSAGTEVPSVGSSITSSYSNISASATASSEKQAERQSAYDTLYNEFSKYGLGSLVEGVKGLIQQNVSPSQFAISLQNTKEYQQRFSANQDRIAKGLRALTPAEYIGLEDQYQGIMRNYGLPASYYSKDSIGTQAGFNKLLSNDVSASELEDRIATAQQRVQNSNPEVLRALKQFYPDLNNADILAYTLDPQNALTDIKRKVTAAEIGGAALAQGLQAQGGTAESLAGLGITKAQAQQGYQNVAEMLPRGSQLADIYGQQPYTQQTAESEVFNTTGSADAAARRKKLTSLETASFSGQSGVGALGRDKNLYGQAYGQQGQY
jgi:hypothetical protein